jgi:UDP-3-O-[3-hydroxymyristoyl] glucosamine N-acyltransferase
MELTTDQVLCSSSEQTRLSDSTARSKPPSHGVSLGELAVRFGCVLRGNPDSRVYRVSSIQDAVAGELTFLAGRKFQSYLQSTRAGAVVLDATAAEQCPVDALISANPHALFARIASYLHPSPSPIGGIHPSAIVDASAQVDATAQVDAHSVLGANVQVGPRVVIGAGSILMDDVIVGADTRLVARVTICERVRIGERCILHPGVVIGADGFGFANEAGMWIKVPQVGSVRIGNDVDIGANTTIDRGAIGDTVIEEGVKLDNHIQIGHNVRVGAHTAMAACVGVSGSTTIGKHCMIAGMVGISGWLDITDGVIVTGRTMVSSSIRQPGTYSGTLPMDDARKFRRNAARFKKLDELAKQVRVLSRIAGVADTSDSKDDVE